MTAPRKPDGEPVYSRQEFELDRFGSGRYSPPPEPKLDDMVRDGEWDLPPYEILKLVHARSLAQGREEGRAEMATKVYAIAKNCEPSGNAAHGEVLLMEMRMIRDWTQPNNPESDR